MRRRARLGVGRPLSPVVGRRIGAGRRPLTLLWRKGPRDRSPSASPPRPATVNRFMTWSTRISVSAPVTVVRLTEAGRHSTLVFRTATPEAAPPAERLRYRTLTARAAPPATWRRAGAFAPPPTAAAEPARPASPQRPSMISRVARSVRPGAPPRAAQAAAPSAGEPTAARVFRRPLSATERWAPVDAMRAARRRPAAAGPTSPGDWRTPASPLMTPRRTARLGRPAAPPAPQQQDGPAPAPRFAAGRPRRPPAPADLVLRAPEPAAPRSVYATSPRPAPQLVWRAPPADEATPDPSPAAVRPRVASPSPPAAFAAARPAPAPSAPPAPPLDMSRLVDEVMRRLDQRVRSERQRRGA